MEGVTLLTCTSDRPVAFGLCERWIRRQTYKGPIQWIVVDDGEKPVVCTGDQEYIRLPPAESPRESFRRNNLAGLEAARYGKLLWIEDDDWYHPDYLGFMVGLLDIRDLAGCGHARYYNIRYRLWRIHPNGGHASLCSTGMRRSLYGVAEKILRESNFTIRTNPQQLDGTLWRRSGIGNKRKVLLPESPHVVGMKGMPGKSGLGIHHQRDEIKPRHSPGESQEYQDDPALKQLEQWIGSDVSFYRSLEF